MNDYISKMRRKIGHDKFIHPGVRILIENDEGQFLTIQRRDNQKLGLPAGALEEGETIEECVRREVKEETGLELLDCQVIGISSDPVIETTQYPNGDQIQYFTIEFYSKSYTGELKFDDINEIKSASFHNRKILESLPENERHILKSLDHYLKENKLYLE